MKPVTFSSDQIRGPLHRLILVCFIGSGFLLYAPEPMMTRLFLSSIIAQHGPLVALIQLISLCYFATLGLNYCYRLCQRKIHLRHATQVAQLKARCLDNEERAVLREFFLQRTSSLVLPVHQPAVQRLMASHILECQEEAPSDKLHQKFGIALAARPFITSNNLRLPVHELTEEDIRYFKAARPEYIKEQLKVQWREQLKAQRRQVA